MKELQWSPYLGGGGRLNVGCAGVTGGADVEVDPPGAVGGTAVRSMLDRSRFMNGFAVGAAEGAGRPEEDKGAPPAMLFD